MRFRCKNTYFQCADSIQKELEAYRSLGQCILSRANDNQFSRPQRARMAAEACVDADASVASEQFRYRSGVPPRSKTRVNSSGFMAAQLDWARPCSRGGRHGLDLPFFAVWGSRLPRPDLIVTSNRLTGNHRAEPDPPGHISLQGGMR